MTELEATILIGVDGREPRSMLVTNVPREGDRIGVKLQAGDDWQYGVCKRVEQRRTGGPVYHMSGPGSV